MGKQGPVSQACGTPRSWAHWYQAPPERVHEGCLETWEDVGGGKGSRTSTKAEENRGCCVCQRGQAHTKPWSYVGMVVDLLH